MFYPKFIGYTCVHIEITSRKGDLEGSNSGALEFSPANVCNSSSFNSYLVPPAPVQ